MSTGDQTAKRDKAQDDAGGEQRTQKRAERLPAESRRRLSASRTSAAMTVKMPRKSAVIISASPLRARKKPATPRPGGGAFG